MSARKLIRRSIRDEQGASAVEFALLVPVMLLIFFTILDVAAYGFAINLGEKSTQMGARMAVVTGSVDSAMESYEFVGQTVGGVTYTQGDRIQASALGRISCTSTSCTCEVTPCQWTPTHNSAAFIRIRDRIRQIYPAVTDAKIVIEYSGSGLGYAGDPAGMDIAPLVTVKLRDMKYSPMALSVFKVDVPLPSFKYSLTIEDASGIASF